MLKIRIEIKGKNFTETRTYGYSLSPSEVNKDIKKVIQLILEGNWGTQPYPY